MSLQAAVRADKGSGARSLVGLVALAVLFAALPGYVTFDHVRDRQILAERGTQVNAWVVGYDRVRKGPDRVVVRPDEPPYFEATLLRRPDGIAFNDRLDIVFDPSDPGRVIAVDEPLVDGWVLLFAFLDLAALLVLIRGVVAARELLRRARVWRPGDVVPRRADPPGPRPPLLAGWQTPQIVLVLIIVPVLSAAVFGLLAASAVGDAAALRGSGVVARAVVVKSVWDGGGRLDVRFPVQDGTKRSAGVTVSGGAYFEGDPVDVVYEPDDPGNARLAGPGRVDVLPWVYGAPFLGFAGVAVVTVPMAFGVLGRRAWADGRGR